MTNEPLWQPSDILNAENEGDAESPKRRGRIPQSAWPRILERHRAGATLSAIAREFDCTPSAISYIVRKAEAAGLTADADIVEEHSPSSAPSATAEPPVVDAPRPARRPRTQVDQVETAAPATLTPAVEQPAEVKVTEQKVESTPQAAFPPTEPDVPRAPSVSRDATTGELFQHDSGRAEAREAARRFEGRENRPPRDRDSREQRFGDTPPRNENRGEVRSENRGEGRNERRPETGDGRRPQQGVPRFPQGGQRFGGRDRQEGRESRPPRDFERSNAERHTERLPAIDPTVGEQPVEVVYPYRQQQRNPARLEAQETPTSPADERMDVAAKACAEAYRAWKTAEKDVQSLGDAIHELRKVIARMEIEISASRKEEQRPIPLPSYRKSQPPPQQPRG